MQVGCPNDGRVGTNGISVYEHSSDYLPALLVHQAPILGWTHVAVVYRNKQLSLYIIRRYFLTAIVSVMISRESTETGALTRVEPTAS